MHFSHKNLPKISLSLGFKPNPPSHTLQLIYINVYATHVLIVCRYASLYAQAQLLEVRRVALCLDTVVSSSVTFVALSQR